MVLATIAPRLGLDERLAAFADRLRSAIGAPTDAAFPDELFSDSEYDAHTWYRETAERVGAAFEAWGYAPDFDPMIYGLVDFAVQSTITLAQDRPDEDTAGIQAGVVEFAIQLLAKTRASDRTKHAARSRRDRLRNLYLAQMRPVAADPAPTSP